jgi:4-carboxymuconolactone decarboxylase
MLRDGTSVPKNLSELAIAVTARFWTAQFEWNAHAPQALRAGVSPDIIEAIRQRKRPKFERPDEEAVYDYVSELYEKKKVSDATYQKLRAHVSPEQAIELTAIAGFYATVAMLIVAFEVDLPAGVEPPLPA